MLRHSTFNQHWPMNCGVALIVDIQSHETLRLKSRKILKDRFGNAIGFDWERITKIFHLLSRQRTQMHTNNHLHRRRRVCDRYHLLASLCAHVDKLICCSWVTLYGGAESRITILWVFFQSWGSVSGDLLLTEVCEATGKSCCRVDKIHVIEREVLASNILSLPATSRVT